MFAVQGRRDYAHVLFHIPYRLPRTPFLPENAEIVSITFGVVAGYNVKQG